MESNTNSVGARINKLGQLPDTGRSMGGGIASILREAIISGTLQPGERLGQDELSAEFRVSQGPVREALRKLEAEGLVQHVSNRGVFVLGLTREELIDVVAPVRALLETHATTRVLASTSADDLLARLSAIVSEMEEAVASEDFRRVNDLDVQFHEVAVGMLDQPHTSQLWQAVMPRLRAEFTRLAPAHQKMEDIVEEHRTLLDQYKTRKASAVRRAIHQHAVTATEQLLDQQAAARQPA